MLIGRFVVRSVGRSVGPLVGPSVDACRSFGWLAGWPVDCFVVIFFVLACPPRARLEIQGVASVPPTLLLLSSSSSSLSPLLCSLSLALVTLFRKWC